MTDTYEIDVDSEEAKALIQTETLFRTISDASLMGALTSGDFEVERDKWNNPSMSRTKPNTPIQQIKDLQGTKDTVATGGKIQVRMIGRLNTDGVRDTETLSGKGGSLDEYTQDIKLGLIRNAVKVNRTSCKYAVDNLDGEHRLALEQWGVEAMDTECINAWTTSPTKVFYLDSDGNPTNTEISGVTPANVPAALTYEGNELTPALFQYLSTYGKTGGTSTSRFFNKIAPISDVNGAILRGVLIVHPHAAYLLKQNPSYQQEIRERYPNTTYWNTALAIIDGVVVFEHPSVPLFTTNGRTFCKGVFTGAQSLAVVWGCTPFFTMEKEDHEAKKEVGWSLYVKVAKLLFNSIDRNSVAVYVECKDIR
jgi:hypothetical protein